MKPLRGTIYKCTVRGTAELVHDQTKSIALDPGDYIMALREHPRFEDTFVFLAITAQKQIWIVVNKLRDHFEVTDENSLIEEEEIPL